MPRSDVAKARERGLREAHRLLSDVEPRLPKNDPLMRDVQRWRADMAAYLHKGQPTK